MDRRQFLRNTTLGAVALSVPAAGSAMTQVFEPASAVRELALACGAREWTGMAGRFAFGLAQPMLADRLSADCQAYRSEKFEPGRFTVYTVNKGEIVFLALEKKIESLNLADYLVPFWCRAEGGSYRRLATLNGFQLEALLRAARHLQTGNRPPAEIGNCLLPAEMNGKRAEPGSFFTRNGKVSTQTYIQTGQTATSIAVETALGVLLEERFESRHLMG